MATIHEHTSNVPRAGLVKDIVSAALGERVTAVALVPEQGNVNRAYDVETSNGSYILRARFDRDEMRQFSCEKRCIDLIREKHDWTPAIVAIGRYEGHCYSIQEKVHGTVGSDYQGNMLKVWEHVGQYANFFHGIRTSGYLYDLFREGPPSEGLWCQAYFDNLGQAESAQIVFLGLLDRGEFDQALAALEPLKALEFIPTLAHGNLSLKNLIIDANGKVHLIDWGSCQGHMGCELDTSELLAFETPQEHIKAYLLGHNLPKDYVEQNLDLIERLRLLRCFTTAHWLCEIGSERKADLASYIAKTRASLQRLPD